jgi:hypothetical protein
MQMSGQLHVPADFPKRKETAVPIDQEVGWTSEPVRTLSERKISLDPAEI